MQYLRSIVVCDDHSNIRHELAADLQGSGIRVFRAQTGKHALRHIESNKDHVKAILLDLKMPGMDGIETARQIQQKHSDVRIIFLTAFDNEDYRDRAAKAGLRIERWIDKDPKTMREASRVAVQEALSRDTLRVVTQSLKEAAQEAGIPSEQLTLVNESFTSRLLSLLPTVPLPEPRISRLSAPTETILELEDVLRDLSFYLDEVILGYSDPSHRQLSWDHIRKTVSSQLWQAVEAGTKNEFRQQLAIQFKMAVLKIEAPVLTLEHLDAAQLSLERLRSPKTEMSDVTLCRDAWEKVGVETLPSFHQILQIWEELYRVAGPQDTPEEDIVGDNDTTASSGR